MGAAKATFQSILKDRMFTDPHAAIEQRAMWAHLEQQKGNDEPAREFVMEFRWPLKYFLPGHKRIAASDDGDVSRTRSEKKSARGHLERRHRHHDPFTFGDTQ